MSPFNLACSCRSSKSWNVYLSWSSGSTITISKDAPFEAKTKWPLALDLTRWTWKINLNTSENRGNLSVKNKSNKTGWEKGEGANQGSAGTFTNLLESILRVRSSCRNYVYLFRTSLMRSPKGEGDILCAALQTFQARNEFRNPVISESHVFLHYFRSIRIVLSNWWKLLLLKFLKNIFKHSHAVDTWTLVNFWNFHCFCRILFLFWVKFWEIIKAKRFHLHFCQAIGPFRSVGAQNLESQERSSRKFFLRDGVGPFTYIHRPHSDRALVWARWRWPRVLWFVEDEIVWKEWNSILKELKNEMNVEFGVLSTRTIISGNGSIRVCRRAR